MDLAKKFDKELTFKMGSKKEIEDSIRKAMRLSQEHSGQSAH